MAHSSNFRNCGSKQPRLTPVDAEALTRAFAKYGRRHLDVLEERTE